MRNGTQRPQNQTGPAWRLVASMGLAALFPIIIESLVLTCNYCGVSPVVVCCLLVSLFILSVECVWANSVGFLAYGAIYTATCVRPPVPQWHAAHATRWLSAGMSLGQKICVELLRSLAYGKLAIRCRGTGLFPVC